MVRREALGVNAQKNDMALLGRKKLQRDETFLDEQTKDKDK